MAWYDDIIGYGKQAIGWLGSGGLGPSLVKTALLGYTLNRITKSITKQNTSANSGPAATPEVDRGVRLQVNPDANHKIPVVYGSAHLGAIVTDAELTNNNTTMYYCLTICEKTGSLLSDGLDSVIEFTDVYWNDQRIVFAEDGITALYSVDREGIIDYSLANLVKVYCYSGGSADPVVPDNYTNASLQPAWNIMPNWNSSYGMYDLVFAIIEVNYNKEKNVTALGDMKFHLTNSMTLPGDCIYDYMTSTRYGAGIDAAEIYT
jgi:hypothetical protein